MIHGTPRGFRDILPEEALAREALADTVRRVFSDHGYLPVETPLLESREVLERAGRIRGVPFQLIDADDRLLMLRPDLTLPIARLVAGRMGEGDLPARLRYAAPVVREQRSLSGEARQFTQLGVELVGAPDGEAEAEVVGILMETLGAVGLSGCTVVCGSVRPLAAAIGAAGVSRAEADRILALVHSSDLVGLDAFVASLDVPGPAAAALRGLPRSMGGVEALDAVDALLGAAGVAEADRGTAELRALAGAVASGPVPLAFDFSIANSFDYYTGLVFKAFAPGFSSSVASGGRYDAVLANLDVPAVGACGFALSLERLQGALDVRDGGGDDRPLRVAVPKGSLFGPCVDLLEAAGLPVDDLRDPGRRLVVAAGDVEYVIVRATDAPAFVAWGGADCGVCGTDSLFEADLDLVQLEDLRFGACRFVVAEPAGSAGAADAAFARRGSYRVATKYPRVTQAYFDSVGCPVDILALHGNIELGPIVGMADRIVDITATGTTLRENDLVVVADDVMDCSARYFAGPAAFRSDARIRALGARLRDAVEKG